VTHAIPCTINRLATLAAISLIAFCREKKALAELFVEATRGVVALHHAKAEWDSDLLDYKCKKTWPLLILRDKCRRLSGSH
jgi:hypothetical protein